MNVNHPPGPSFDPDAPNSLYTVTPPNQPSFNIHWLFLQFIVGLQIAINCLFLGRYGICEVHAVNGVWKIRRVMNKQMENDDK